MASNVTFTPTKGNGIRCAIRSPQGWSLSLCGALTDIEPPTVDGHPAMVRNRALVKNLWAYGKHEKQFRMLRNQEKRASHASRPTTTRRSPSTLPS